MLRQNLRFRGNGLKAMRVFFLAKSLLSTFHCINMECVKIKSLELVDAMTNWKYENR